MKITDLIQKNTFRGHATATPSTVATQNSIVANVAGVAEGASKDIAYPVLELLEKEGLDPDRNSWPHTAAYNRSEIAVSIKRLRFLRSRLNEDEAQKVIDLLISRDRKRLDMSFCFECTSLEGYGAGPWKCTNAIRAEVHFSQKESLIPRDWPYKLQRCPGFKGILL